MLGTLPRAMVTLLLSRVCSASRLASPVVQPALSAAASRPLFRTARAPVCMSASAEAAEASPEAAGKEATRQRVAKLLGSGTSQVGKTVVLKGWVRTVRSQKTFSFVELNDGSSLKGVQVVAPSEIGSYGVVEDLTTGCAISVVGEVVESPAKGQSVEVRAQSVELVGGCPGDEYPLQKKRHSLEFLRSIAHLRPRTNTIGAISRVRSALAYATHDFFTSEGFQYVQTPLITASDCEGAGEMFRVTTLPMDKPAKDADDFFGRERRRRAHEPRPLPPRHEPTARAAPACPNACARLRGGVHSGARGDER